MTNEFAFVLTEILTAGRRDGRLSVKLVAEKCGITPSYLSNVKRGHRRPPGRKSLLKLLDVLHELETPASEVQRLEAAYRRVQLGKQAADDPLTPLLEGRWEAERLSEQLAADQDLAAVVANDGLPPTPLALARGNQAALLEAMIDLVKRALCAGIDAGDVHLTWPANAPELAVLRKRLFGLLRVFLAEPSPRRVRFLWPSGPARDFSVVLEFIEVFLGADRCDLYELGPGHEPGDRALVAGIGCLSARPAGNGSYWIRQSVAGFRPEADTEMIAARDHFAHLQESAIGERPLVTVAVMVDFLAAEWSGTVAAAEAVAGERILLRPTFSYAGFPTDVMAHRLEARGLAEADRTSYLENHRRRREGLKRRMRQGREVLLHNRVALRREFAMTLAGPHPVESAAYRAQLCDVLRSFGRGPGFRLALDEDSGDGQLAVTDDLAFLQVDLSRRSPPLQEPERLHCVMAITRHPEMLYRLGSGLAARWDAVSDEWRSDTTPGRRRLVGFLVAEALNAMLAAGVPRDELLSFIGDLVESVPPGIADPYHSDFMEAARVGPSRRFADGRITLIADKWALVASGHAEIAVEDPGLVAGLAQALG